MSAPGSVWVLVWPDGSTAGPFESYVIAERWRLGTPNPPSQAVTLRYDLAGVVDTDTTEVGPA